MTSEKNLKIAVAGLGAVGLPVAKWLAEGDKGFDLVAVSANDKERATQKISDFKMKPPIVDLDELVGMADIIVEGLPPERYFDLAVPVIEQGKVLVAVTVTQLLERPDLIEKARDTGARIIVPTGALMAFDAVNAARHGTIHSLVMATRKPFRRAMLPSLMVVVVVGGGDGGGGNGTGDDECDDDGCGDGDAGVCW